MQIYIHRDGQQFGPYSSDDVKVSLASGSFHLNDLCWYEGCSDWMPLSQVSELASSKAPPPPRPTPQQPIPPRPILSKPIKIFAAVTLSLIGLVIVASILIPREDQNAIPGTPSQAPAASASSPPPRAVPNPRTIAITGKYKQTDSNSLVTTVYIWDFLPGGIVTRTGTSSFYGGETMDHNGRGTYQITGHTLIAKLADVEMKFVFDIEANGDLTSISTMPLKKPIHLKKQ